MTGLRLPSLSSRMPWTGIVKTYNTNAQTPDSAGTATAMNTGFKTKAVSATPILQLLA